MGLNSADQARLFAPHTLRRLQSLFEETRLRCWNHQHRAAHLLTLGMPSRVGFRSSVELSGAQGSSTSWVGRGVVGKCWKEFGLRLVASSRKNIGDDHLLGRQFIQAECLNFFYRFDLELLILSLG